jgi:hypothetical protein
MIHFGTCIMKHQIPELRARRAHAGPDSLAPECDIRMNQTPHANLQSAGIDFLRELQIPSYPSSGFPEQAWPRDPMGRWKRAGGQKGLAHVMGCVTGLVCPEWKHHLSIYWMICVNIALTRVHELKPSERVAWHCQAARINRQSEGYSFLHVTPRPHDTILHGLNLSRHADHLPFLAKTCALTIVRGMASRPKSAGS